MKLNKTSRDKALRYLLVLKKNYADQFRMNEDVRKEVLINVAYHGPFANCDQVEQAMRDIFEMNRDMSILCRNLDWVRCYLLVEPDVKKLDRAINSHIEIRTSFSDKWNKTIKKRAFLCELLVAMNTPENDEDGL